MQFYETLIIIILRVTVIYTNESSYSYIHTNTENKINNRPGTHTKNIQI